MNKNIIELKIDNKDKNFEKYLKPQWSWKTFVSMDLFISALIFVVKDLEVDFVKLVKIPLNILVIFYLECCLLILVI